MTKRESNDLGCLRATQFDAAWRQPGGAGPAATDGPRAATSLRRFRLILYVPLRVFWRRSRGRLFFFVAISLARVLACSSQRLRCLVARACWRFLYCWVNSW